MYENKLVVIAGKINYVLHKNSVFIVQSKTTIYIALRRT